MLLISLITRKSSTSSIISVLSVQFNGVSVICSGASWVLFGTPRHPPHYDPLHSSPFYLKGPWTAAKLGNPPKPVLIRIPRVTPGLVKGQDADQ